MRADQMECWRALYKGKEDDSKVRTAVSGEIGLDLQCV